MKLEVAPKQTDELSATPIVHQTAFWGRVHRRLGFGTEAFDLELRPPAHPGTHTSAVAECGDLLVVRSPLSADVDCAYVPFGPEITPDADNIGTFLEQLSRELRPLLGQRCAFIRWDFHGPPSTLAMRRTSRRTANGSDRQRIACARFG